MDSSRPLPCETHEDLVAPGCCRLLDICRSAGFRSRRLDPHAASEKPVRDAVGPGTAAQTVTRSWRDDHERGSIIISRLVILHSLGVRADNLSSRTVHAGGLLSCEPNGPVFLRHTCNVGPTLKRRLCVRCACTPTRQRLPSLREALRNGGKAVLRHVPKIVPIQGGQKANRAEPGG